MTMEKLGLERLSLTDKSDAFYSLLDLLLVIEPKLTFVLPACFNVMAASIELFWSKIRIIFFSKYVMRNVFLIILIQLLCVQVDLRRLKREKTLKNCIKTVYYYSRFSRFIFSFYLSLMSKAHLEVQQEKIKDR